MNAVEIDNGYKYYGSEKNKNVILNQINVTVKYGSIYGLLGASGCGKTTLLSCIVGIRKLNGGSIKVLGGVPGKKGTGVPGVRVGYMPQDIALLPEFTIEETLFYFGRIFGMRSEVISDRCFVLRQLLELPFGDRYVKQLSGGQQRCVSFAASMIHEPELLILDEPTVGLDPILREKMWGFLKSTTQSQNITVIITTHYIEEARQADCIGMMRNGILLIENSPSEILSQIETNSLEEAFLRLCMKQESEIPNQSKYKNKIQRKPEIEEENSLLSLKCSILMKNSKVETNQTSLSKMGALMSKTITSLARQPTGVFSVLYFPIISLLTLYFGTGGPIQGLQFGIVNKEVSNQNFCFNESLTHTHFHDYECDLNFISCRFLNNISDSVMEKIFYDSYDSALEDTLSGKINGFIHIQSNYSESVSFVRDYGTGSDDGSIDNYQIEVFHDKRNYPFSAFIQKNLMEIFNDFIQSLLSDCQISVKIGSVPLDIKQPIFGKLDVSYRDYVVSGSLAIFVFYFAILVTSTVFVGERSEGIWDRNLVAGVTMKEMLLTHVITQSGIVIIQCIEILILLLYFFEIENNGNIFLLTALLALNGLCGLFCGIFVSIYCQSHSSSSYICTGIFYPIVLLSGCFWPIEAIEKHLRYFAYCLPTTMSSESFRMILSKGWTLQNKPVLIGFGATILWIVVFLILSVIKLRRMT